MREPIERIQPTITTADIRYKKTTRITADYGINDIYKYYLSTTNEGFRLPANKVKAVLKDLNETIIAKLLSGPTNIHLLCRCGDMCIKKTKMRFTDVSALRIDWAATKKANKKVYHLNEHRDGHRYRFFWSKPKLKNITAYSFRPTRANKRALSQILQFNKDIDFSS